MYGGAVPDSANSRLKKLHGGLLKKKEKKVRRRIRPGWEIFRCQIAVWVKDKQQQANLFFLTHFICTTIFFYSLSMLFSKKKKKSFSSITSGEFHPSSFNLIHKEIKREPWKVPRRRCPIESANK